MQELLITTKYHAVMIYSWHPNSLLFPWCSGPLSGKPARAISRSLVAILLSLSTADHKWKWSTALFHTCRSSHTLALCVWMSLFPTRSVSLSLFLPHYCLSHLSLRGLSKAAWIHSGKSVAVAKRPPLQSRTLFLNSFIHTRREAVIEVKTWEGEGSGGRYWSQKKRPSVVEKHTVWVWAVFQEGLLYKNQQENPHYSGGK